MDPPSERSDPPRASVCACGCWRWWPPLAWSRPRAARAAALTPHPRGHRSRRRSSRSLSACESRALVTQGFSHGDITKTQDQFLQLAQCMRGRGVDVPDPDFSDGGHDPGAQFLDAINKSDPTVQEALKACQQQVFGSEGLGHGGGH